MLNDDRSRTNLIADEKIADLDLNDVAPSQPAIDCKIEQNTVTQPLLAIQVEPYGLYLLRPKGTLCAELASRVPRSPPLGAGVVHRMSHGVFSILTKLAGGDSAPRSITTEGVGPKRSGRSGAPNSAKADVLHGDCRRQEATQVRHRSSCRPIQKADIHGVGWCCGSILERPGSRSSSRGLC